MMPFVGQSVYYIGYPGSGRHSNFGQIASRDSKSLYYSIAWAYPHLPPASGYWSARELLDPKDFHLVWSGVELMLKLLE